jgi:hypothetical protein
LPNHLQKEKPSREQPIRLWGDDQATQQAGQARNKDRFPDDFIFQITPEAKAEVVANCDRFAKLKFSKPLPSAFMEHADNASTVPRHQPF